jgi:TnpA family transposase
MFYKKFLKINNILLVNLVNRQAKVNLMDLDLNKKYIYSIGLVLKILDMYKKSSRRSVFMLKYLLNFLIKKYLTSWKAKKFMFIVKGLKKNFIKILYFFKFIVSKCSVNVFYINPLKSFRLIKIKKVRSIKKRIYKKLIDFNKI